MLLYRKIILQGLIISPPLHSTFLIFFSKKKWLAPTIDNYCLISIFHKMVQTISSFFFYVYFMRYIIHLLAWLRSSAPRSDKTSRSAKQSVIFLIIKDLYSAKLESRLIFSTYSSSYTKASNFSLANHRRFCNIWI